MHRAPMVDPEGNLVVQMLLQAQNVRHLHHCWRMSLFTVIIIAMLISLSYNPD